MRTVISIGLLAATLSACATGPSRFPVQATRFHYDPMAARGTVRVEAPPNEDGVAFRSYAAAVERELARLGYTPAPAGATPQFTATVAYTRSLQPLGPRRSPVTIGLGGGGFSGGRGGGGVGIGGGIGFPLGSSRGRDGIATNLSVRIRQGSDAKWEGEARSLTDAGAPDADPDSVAARLAAALFADFPGESGRTIEVK
jgi:hypothetical protein